MPLTGLLSVFLAGVIAADQTIDPAHPYGYAANAGWVNAGGDALHGAVIGLSYCSGYLWSANCGWIGLGEGPTNGWRYSNAAACDYGVNHDGRGNLRGYAYGANVGWVVFESVGNPRVDLRTGVLSGAAWGANVGWISLSNTMTYVRTERLDVGPDADTDGIADVWEYQHTNTLTVLADNGHDADNDGASDVDEFAADTDPFNAEDAFTIVSLCATGTTDQIAWAARPTRLYRIEATNALGATVQWEDTGLGLLGPAEASTMTQSVTGMPAGARYYSVRAIVPLSE